VCLHEVPMRSGATLESCAMAVSEASIARTDEGAVVQSEGWFVLNTADARWMREQRSGEWCDFEPADAEFAEYGVNIHVIRPGQPNGLYHAESAQEDFLVLSGECICLIEGQERRLRAWDFVHCPAGTHHIFVGAGDGPCAILMVGARGQGKTLHYPVDELAARYGASASEETGSPREAYREWSRKFEPVRASWPPGT
jgi:uncharacterized cupin superfamily protein